MAALAICCLLGGRLDSSHQSAWALRPSGGPAGVSVSVPTAADNRHPVLETVDLGLPLNRASAPAPSNMQAPRSSF